MQIYEHTQTHINTCIYINTYILVELFNYFSVY